MRRRFSLLELPSGASRNGGGRLYENGKSYGLTVKLEVAEQYEILKNADGNGRPPSGRALADAAKVSPSFARKVIDELARYGRVLSPKEIVKNYARGVGSKAVDERGSAT